MKTIILLGLSFTFASAQFVTNGTCPSFMECRSSVDMSQDMLKGIWYLYASIPYFFQENKKCTYFNCTSGTEPNSMHFDKVEYDITTNARRDSDGRFNFTLDGLIDLTYTDLLLPFNFTTIELTNDYWAVVSCYTCEFFGSPPGIYGYILTRLQYPPCDTNKGAVDSFEKCGIPKDALLFEEQGACRFC